MCICTPRRTNIAWCGAEGCATEDAAIAVTICSNVTHPKHYNTGKVEVIDVIEDWGLDFHLGNAIKYIARAGKKDPSKYKEDLEKAVWYLKRRIECEVEANG